MTKRRLDDMTDRAGGALPGSLSVEARMGRPVTRIVVAGELDLATVPLLRAVLDPLYGRPQEVVELDLADVGFLDSEGLCTIIAARRRLVAQDTVLRIVRASRPVRRLLSIYRLGPVFELPDDADDPRQVRGELVGSGRR